MSKGIKDFQLPMRLELEKEPASANYGRFSAEPFERGFGTTIGNSLRRVLLSSLPGAAVTSVKIEGAYHEFSTLPGITEDLTIIILNIKNLRLKLHTDKVKAIRLKKKGPGDAKASDIEHDADITVLNPDLKIATLDKNIGRENYIIGHMNEKGQVSFEDDEQAEALDGMQRFIEQVDDLYATQFLDEVQAEQLLFEGAKDYEIQPNLYFDEMDKELIDRLNELLAIGIESPEEVIPMLEEAIEDHPDEPILYNYLMSAYEDIGNEEKAEEITISNYERFPDYLMVKFPYFFLLLDHDKMGDLDALIEDKWDITLLAPDREVFSLQEVVAYYSFMTNYALAKGNVTRASVYLNSFPESDMLDEQQQSHIFNLSLRIINAKLKGLLGEDFDPTDMGKNMEKLAEKTTEGIRNVIENP